MDLWSSKRCDGGKKQTAILISASGWTRQAARKIPGFSPRRSVEFILSEDFIKED